MSWLYSRALEVACSEADYSAGAQFPAVVRAAWLLLADT